MLKKRIIREKFDYINDVPSLNVNLGRFLAIFKTSFWAPVTKYFKIENTSENKKVPPWWGDEGIWPRTNARVSRTKNLHFQSMNYCTSHVLSSACRYAAICMYAACVQQFMVPICSIGPKDDIGSKNGSKTKPNLTCISSIVKTHF